MRRELLLLFVLLAACPARRGFAPLETPDLTGLGAPVRVLDPLLAHRGATLGLDGNGERLLVIETEGPVRLSLRAERLEATLRIVLQPRTFPRARTTDSVIVEVTPRELSLATGSRREQRPRSTVAKPHEEKASRLDLAIEGGEARARFGGAEVSLPGVAPGLSELVFSVEGGTKASWPPADAPVILAELRVAGAAATALDPLARANALLACGKPAEAVPVYGEALENPSSLRQLRRGRSLALVATGKYADGALDFAAAQALDARLEPAFEKTVDALLDEGDLALAVETALEASRLAAPRDARAAGKFFDDTIVKAKARAKNERDPLKRARALAASRSLDDLAEAKTALEQAPEGLERRIALSEVLRLEAGVLHARQDDAWRPTYASAALELDRARALGPQDERVFRGLGIVAFFLGKTGEAISLLARATKLDERSFEAWFFLGRALADPGEATRAFGHACSLRPFSSNALVFRAIAREKGGDRAGARSDLDAAQELGCTLVKEMKELEGRLR